MEKVVVGVEDPLQMSDTEQGDTVPETQQELDSSHEDIADMEDTHAVGRTQKGKGIRSSSREVVSEDKADKRGKNSCCVS